MQQNMAWLTDDFQGKQWTEKQENNVREQNFLDEVLKYLEYLEPMVSAP